MLRSELRHQIVDGLLHACLQRISSPLLQFSREDGPRERGKKLSTRKHHREASVRSVCLIPDALASDAIPGLARKLSLGATHAGVTCPHDDDAPANDSERHGGARLPTRMMFCGNPSLANPRCHAPALYIHGTRAARRSRSSIAFAPPQAPRIPSCWLCFPQRV